MSFFCRILSSTHLSPSVTKGKLYSVCIFTSIRISAVVAYDPLDGTYSIWQTAVWSQLEPILGILCACIPLMRPILDRFIIRRKVTTGLSQTPKSHTGYQRTESLQDIDNVPLTESSAWANKSVITTVGVGRQSNFPDGEVRVKTEWAVHDS